jgi:hypothetical protein
MMRRLALIVLSSVLLLSACTMEKVKTKETILEETLRTYAATIRWGDMTQALAFVDPKYRQAHPLSDLDLARYRQVQVTAYNDQPAAPLNDNEIAQTVEIGLVNVNTQSARSIVDHQVWRYDEKEKRWWLTTGLPDITRHE